jgi:hypothetical protein
VTTVEPELLSQTSLLARRRPPVGHSLERGQVPPIFWHPGNVDSPFRFPDPRKEGYDQNTAVNYVRHARELFGMSEQELAEKFNTQLTRACRSFPKKVEAFQRFIEMHKRHGEVAKKVVERQFKLHADRFFRGDLPPSSLLARGSGQAHLTSLWRRYADRIVGFLKIGLPKICKTEKPRDELRLQEIS